MHNDLDPVMAIAVTDYLTGPDPNRRNDSSATWTISSGDMGISSDHDEFDDRVHFVDEYNRLARKVRCRHITGPIYTADKTQHRIRLLVREDLHSCPVSIHSRAGKSHTTGCCID